MHIRSTKGKVANTSGVPIEFSVKAVGCGHPTTGFLRTVAGGCIPEAKMFIMSYEVTGQGRVVN